MSRSPDFDYVFYHAKCADGIASAWIAQRFDQSIFSRLHGKDSAQFVGIKAGSSLHDMNGLYSKKKLLFLDVVPSNIYELVNDAHYVQIHDHHVTNKPILAELDKDFPLVHVKVIYSDTLCGAEITWQHYNPGQDFIWFVQVVAAHDCWRWDSCSPHLKLLWRSLFQGKDLTLEQFDDIATRNANELNNFMNSGYELLQEDKKEVAAYCEKAKAVMINNKEAFTYVEDVPWLHLNEVGAELAKSTPFAMLAGYDKDDKHWSCSLRSNESGIHVGEWAVEMKNRYPDQVLKGGGHARAAGVNFKDHPLEVLLGSKE